MELEAASDEPTQPSGRLRFRPLAGNPVDKQTHNVIARCLSPQTSQSGNITGSSSSADLLGIITGQLR